jgi:hypothetical protein
MRIPRENQETVITFEAETGEWDIYTCVPAHIRLFLENERISNADIKVLTEFEDKPTSIRFSIENSAISIRSFFKKKRIKRKPSEAQLQARQNFAEMVRSK